MQQRWFLYSSKIWQTHHSLKQDLYYKMQVELDMVVDCMNLFEQFSIDFAVQNLRVEGVLEDLYSLLTNKNQLREELDKENACLTKYKDL